MKRFKKNNKSLMNEKTFRVFNFINNIFRKLFI